MTTFNKSLTLDTQLILKRVVTFVSTALLDVPSFVPVNKIAKSDH